MRLLRLLLQAFGPFTNRVVDFSTGASNLHLIYGANEAGKSSALRAMLDLRFGIPLRSPDDFVHAAGDLRIGGIFLDQAGERIGLVRRKGRGQTLSRLDVETEQPDPASIVEIRHERDLTGGLERTDFEAMFGLNHARLREGGQMLLSGAGDVGTTMFEASVGGGGIAALLSGLEADAKKLYSPRAQNAVINDARRQLDEQRQLWRQALTKPSDWQVLNRAHEATVEALGEITRTLEVLRRRESELTELRTVEPLLRDHDRFAADTQALGAIPDLPDNAREKRLAAQQSLEHAERDLKEAQVELDRCALALESLVYEPRLLDHAGAIERLVEGMAAAARQRVEVGQQQAAIARIENDLTVTIARWATGRSFHDLLAAVPSAADRVALDAHLTQVSRLSVRLDGYRERAEQLKQALETHKEQPSAPTDRAMRHNLAAAVSRAQSLGDVVGQSSDMERQIRELERKLDQALSDLAVSSAEALRRARPLLDSEIAQAKQDLLDIDERSKKMRGEQDLVARDLDSQRLRQRQLAAEGEVVTAETLRLARERRDAGWMLIRRRYIEPLHEGKAAARDLEQEPTWPGAFESSMQEADRQADLLRADAKRAAALEECSVRITQMEARRIEIDQDLSTLSGGRQALLVRWAQRVQASGLPDQDPDTLREWQGRRYDALQLADRVDALCADRDRLVEKIQNAGSDIREALRTLDCPINDVKGDAVMLLSSLIEQGVRWEKSIVEAEADRSARCRALEAQLLEREKIAGVLAETKAEWQQHVDALRAWHARLWLPPDAIPDAVKARLKELDDVVRQASALTEAQERHSLVLAILNDLEQQSHQLAHLLAEPIPQALEDFADRLRVRLVAAKAGDHERKTLLRDQRRAQEKQRHAGLEKTAQEAALARLCAVAGVSAVDELPEREEAAARKRDAKKCLSQVRQQIAAASSRSEQQLRQSLSGRDALTLASERDQCRADIALQEQAQAAARQAEEQARRALEAIDSSDRAALAREAMESASERYRSAIRPWVRLRLARALLQEALNRFRERAQAPMVRAASSYFSLITGGRYERLFADDTPDKPVLCALRTGGIPVKIEEMSEGTADQLYLALRLAALDVRRTSHPQIPLVLDDALITSDDERVANILRALARFAEGGQVMLFTHHRHLLDLARATLGEPAFVAHQL